MAKNPKGPVDTELLPGRFIPVDVAGSYLSGSRRNPAGGVIYPSGRLAVNAAGSAGLLRLAGAEMQRPDLGLYFAADPAAREIAGRFLTADRAPVVPFRYDRKARTFILYLHGVFAENPGLRPAGREAVSMSFRLGEGYEYVVIHLGQAAKAQD